MPAVTRYQCAICGVEYHAEQEMRACEARGEPVRPTWLDARIGKEVAGFGEVGIVPCTLRTVVIRNVFGHNIGVEVHPHPYLGSNQSHYESYLPLCAIDPMQGVDFMRYERGGESTRKLLAEWAKWCRVYGIEPDPTKAIWWPAWQDSAAVFEAEWRAVEGSRSLPTPQ